MEYHMDRAQILSKVKKILERHGRHGVKRELMGKQKLASNLINTIIPTGTMRSVNEEAVIKQYSVQAVGRKRNTMMNAMQLNDAEFMNWVQDRLYRLAFDNEKPVSSFTVKDLMSGLQRWENLFSTQDKEWGTYRDPFMKYKDRFIKAASVIMNTGEASGSLNDPPSKAAPNNVDGAPSSPTMLKFQASGGPNAKEQGGSAPTRGGGGGNGAAAAPKQQAYGPAEYLQYFQQLLSMEDKEFAEFVQDKILSSEKDPSAVNKKMVKKLLDSDEKEVDKVFAKQTKDMNKLYKKYSKRFLSTVDAMLSSQE
jgi:hypothetical protein